MKYAILLMVIFMKKQYYLQKKIFTYYSIIIITIILISFMAFYLYTYTNIEKNAIGNLSNITDINRNQLDTLIRDMDKLALQIIANPTIINIFTDVRKNVSTDNYFETYIQDRNDVIAIWTSYLCKSY